MVDPLGQRETVRQSSAPCLAQRLDSPRPDPGRNTSSQEAPGSQQRRWKETWWLDVGTMAVGAQCHMGCDRLLTHWQHTTCRKMLHTCFATRTMLPVSEQPSHPTWHCAPTGSAAAATSVRKRLNTVRSLPLTCFFSDGGRRLTKLTASLQKSEEEPRFAQPIRGKQCSCTNVFQWQFSVSMLCALPTRSQFQSPHHNHSGHTFLLLLILKPWEWNTGA